MIHSNFITPEDNRLEDTLENVDIPGTFTSADLPDIDRGYAWVVLVAAIGSLMLTGASTFAAGMSTFPCRLKIFEEHTNKMCNLSNVYSVCVSVINTARPLSNDMTLKLK